MLDFRDENLLKNPKKTQIKAFVTQKIESIFLQMKSVSQRQNTIQQNSTRFRLNYQST